MKKNDLRPYPYEDHEYSDPERHIVHYENNENKNYFWIGFATASIVWSLTGIGLTMIMRW